MSRSGLATVMSQRNLSSSKASLVESSVHINGAASSSSTSEDETDVVSDSDSEESVDDGLTMSERLAKHGLNYKSLFTTTVRKLESGSSVRLRPPLIESLFANVPPVINFVTLDDKSTLLFIFIRIFLSHKFFTLFLFVPSQRNARVYETTMQVEDVLNYAQHYKADNRTIKL